MPIGQNHYNGLINALNEIRDEMRGLRDELQKFLELPQPIIVQGIETSLDQEELKQQFHKWERQTNGS